MERLMEELKKRGEMKLNLGASQDEIIMWEKNNMILPQCFKEWLRYSDGGDLFLPSGVQLYGVAHSPLIDIDDDDRPSKDYLVIGSLASGDPILCQKDRETICIYNHDAGVIEEDEIYKDFYAFLEDLYDLLGIGEE